MSTNTNELKLLGLKALADHHNRMLSGILKAALEITHEADPSGHTSDWIYGERDHRSPAELIALVERQEA